MSKYVRHKKKDDNHKEIQAHFERSGAGVKDVSSLPDFVDIIITYMGVAVAVEIKDGEKAPSSRKLTAGELDFKNYWEAHGGKWALVESIKDADGLLASIAERS
jgi:hypothetical protein